MHINSPGLWPTGVLDPSTVLLAYLPFLLSHLSTFLLASLPSFLLSLFPQASYKACLVSRVAALPTGLAKTSSSIVPRWRLAAPFGEPKANFYIFERFSADLKNMFFMASHRNDQQKFSGVAPKRPKKQSKSTLGGPVSETGSQK